MYETSGLWSAMVSGNRALSRYCSPGSWAGGLTPDEYEGEDIYLEYEPAFAVLDISTGSLSEQSLGEDPLRHCVLSGSEAALNRMGSEGFSSWTEWKKRMAGYESSEGLHKIFLHYRSFAESSFEDFAKLFSLSPTAGTVLGDTTELEEPGPLALWAGDVVAVDQGAIKKV